MRPHLFKKLLQNYRSGKTHLVHTQLVDDWYESFGEESPERDPIRKKILRNDLHARIRSRLFPEEVRKIHSRRKFFLPISAAAAILIAIGMAFWFSKQQQDLQLPEAQWVMIRAEQGKLKKVQLPDSTTVWLNAGSTLGFHTPFGQTGNRQVSLEEGEAFFEVTPDAERPFIVRSGTLSTRVLGTSFNVKSYTELDQMQISVVTGTVEVFQDSLKLGILNHGDELTYDKATRLSAIQQLETEESKGWMDGKTILRQASFEELAVAMFHSFGLTLQAGNKAISTQRYTVQLSRELPVDKLIDVICSVHNNTYRKEGNVITIY